MPHPSEQEIEAVARAMWTALHENAVILGSTWDGLTGLDRTLYLEGARRAIEDLDALRRGEPAADRDEVSDARRAVEREARKTGVQGSLAWMLDARREGAGA